MPYELQPIAESDDLDRPPLLLPLAKGLTTRGITSDTTERYRVYSTGKPGQLVAQFSQGWKYREGGWTQGTEKKTWWLPGSKRELFGIHLWDGTQQPVYLCEGMTDAMALSQRLPSALCLALEGEPSLELWTDWLKLIADITGGDHMLYLCFDSDSQGAKYTRHVDRNYSHSRCALVIPPPYKDVAELLMADPKALLQWQGLPSIPPNIRPVKTVVDDMKVGGKGIPQADSTGYTQLDRLVGGYTPGSFLLIAGGAKQGKSSFANQLVLNYLSLYPDRGVLHVPLEMTDEETSLLLGAASLGVYLPDADTDTVMAEVSGFSKLYMVRHFGELSIPVLGELLDAVPVLGIKLVVIDHITAAGTSDIDGLQTSSLDAFCYYLKRRLNELGISALVVSHISGGDTDLVTASNLRGSRALAQVPTCVLGVRRLDDGITDVYVAVPDRRTGRTGKVEFEYDNGRYTPMFTLKDKLL